MKKLMLVLEALKVESFATAAPPRAAGTVRAHGDTSEWDCEGDGDSKETCLCSDLCTRTCNSGPVACCADD
jgi:hypothetical protein